MATFVAALYAAAASAGGAAAAGGAGAAVAGSVGAFTSASAASTGLFGLSLSQTIFAGASAVSALGSIAAGAAQSRALKEQASGVRIQASEERERGAERARRSAMELERLVGAQTAAYAASGIDISAGSPSTVRERTVREGEREIDITRRNAEMAALQRQRQARGLMRDASAARFGGLSSAVGTIGGAARVLM